MLWDQSLWAIFRKGGFAMWPLLACSVMGVAITVERTLYFLRLRFNYERFVADLQGHIAHRRLAAAALLCRRHPHPVPRLAGEYLKHLRDDALRDDVLKRIGSQALECVEARLRWLAALTHIAPLLGLLGTVTGLVTAFHRIELMGGQVRPGDLASGIWEALITTVFGLVIAIPCMVAYHGFEGIADRIARRMQFILSELDEMFGKASSGRFTADDPEAADDALRAVQ